ncbi:MAG TPA: hypothetical protein VFB12_10775 [Ktedonobacteraceae bacterium]|nr:hypothetical protein [Ktedonobacteraceae bacterium]
MTNKVERADTRVNELYKHLRALALEKGPEAQLPTGGARIIRWPGDSLSDAYHWQSHTFEQGWANPNNTFDAFMQAAQKADVRPMITVNYGSGSPQEAAGWVQYANKGGSGYTASPTATIYTYGTSGGGITSTSGSSSSVTVAPYSLTVLVLG